MKRVYCLYRVSSKAQVEGDDIPMQKQACREFAERQGWEIVSEFSEKGVSGFKVSAKDRDAIQDIQKAAVEKQFDILLVFMFDRLGRKDDETPFVVEWFVDNGIEVWSATEGQQKFDNHVDKLMNYIRFWQASGESIKTSVRTSTRMRQLAQEGIYYGGKVPYGYRLVHKGRYNKKGHPVNDIEIDPFEAGHVKLIYEKYVHEGLGLRRICHYLDDNGIRGSNGKPISFIMVRYILQNTLLVGIMTCGDVCSDLLPELRIIDDELFLQAQKLRQERAQEKEEQKRTLPLNTKGQSLLSGNLFCACCGGRLNISVNRQSYVRKDGTCDETKQVRYVCYNKIRKLRKCTGQSTYSMAKLDSIVAELIMSLFKNIKGANESELIEKSYLNELASCKAKLKSAKSGLVKYSKNLEDLKSEVIKSIQGTSKFEAGLLSDLIKQTEEMVIAAESEICLYETELENKQHHLTAIKEDYQKLINWSEIFKNSIAETKKMITAYLIESVKVKSGYELEVKFNVAFEQFFNAA